MQRRARFLEARGPLAMKPQAWGQDFLVFFGEGGSPPPPYELEGDAAVVTVCGPLMQHDTWIWDSYDAIRERWAAACACAEARRVILRGDSPGGEAAGCLELAAELRAMAKAAGKEFLAFTDTEMASAMYALASGADRIVVTPTGSVGSIGVVQAHVDVTAQDAMFGMRWTWIANGDRKLDGNPHVALSKEGAAAIRGAVDQLAGMFFALLEEHRGMAPEATKALDGALVFGVKAVASGLADQVSTWSELIAGAAASAAPPEETNMSKYDEAMGALKRAAEGDDEDAKKAKKALKAIEDGEKPGDGEGKEKKEGEARAAEEPPPPSEDKEKKEKEARVRAAGGGLQASASPGLVDVARELQEIKAERAAEKEAAERAALLAKRPDFTGAVLSTLQTAPMAQVREAVEKWPVIASREGALARAAAGAGAAGTRGATQTGEGGTSTLSEEETTHLDERMGLRSIKGGVKREGRHFEISTMTPEAARAALAAKDKAAGAGAAGASTARASGAAMAAEDLD